MKRVKVFLGLTYLPIYVQLVYKYPPSFMLRINIWVVAYFESKKFLKEILSGHYNIKKKCSTKSWKKTPTKVAQKYSIFFFITALSYPNGPNRRTHVVYRPTIYNTGTLRELEAFMVYFPAHVTQKALSY